MTIVTGLQQCLPWFVSAAPLYTILCSSCELEKLTEAASNVVSVLNSPGVEQEDSVKQPVFNRFDAEPSIQKPDRLLSQVRQAIISNPLG